MQKFLLYIIILRVSFSRQGSYFILAIKNQGLSRPKYEFFKDCKQGGKNENMTF